jgi:hypothetical protein
MSENDNTTVVADKKKILRELFEKQLKNVPIDRKLHFKDLRRITKYINTSIFDPDNCCMWNGYVTNETNIKRGTYVNFFFRKKKVALHRLLYENFVGCLGNDSYLKFSCDENGAGKCCNISHMIKCTYSSSDGGNHHKDKDSDDSDKRKSKCKQVKNAVTDLKISFD